ncbi:MAG: bifunctional DNA primase/polymerase, partial [Planctomycetes bacterium]|nr:bifunctional DNA primase/polymerase [Planctomycetota bacterium]
MDTTMSTPAATGQAAIGYLERGWAPIDIPYRSKNPNRNRWQKERHTEADLQRRFNGRPRNVGVLLGAPSDGLIDIDLDHMVAVEMAPDLLPPTASTFGRRSKPRSHYEYQATGPIATKKWKSKVYGTLVELRSTGCQTVFPGSVHECGEPIEWVEDGDPAKIDPDHLTTEVGKLASAVMAKLEVQKVDKCFSAMMRLTDPDHGDGSLRLLKAARLAVEHDLTDQQALDCIGKYAHERPFAKPWG